MRLPDPRLIDAYKTGFIYTQILRSGDELKTGANGYDKKFSYDVIGILANLFTQGYTAHGLLLRASKALDATISANQLNYLPCSCSMTEPNTDNRCANAEDANWAAPFLFGRWAWDGYLFGAPLSGAGLSLIDAT